jgi:hypothetical protein
MSITSGVNGEQKLPQAESTQQKFIGRKGSIFRNRNQPVNDAFSVEETIFT